jgi:ABC-type nitrate/sulfonate/bicarbonate transport system substrate-binding protein
MRIAVPDLVTNSYFPALAAEELGYYAAEGLEAHVELLSPAHRAMAALRDGRADAVAAGAHTTLTAFPQWQGAKLVVALAQGTPWLLVLRADIPAQQGDLSSVKGLHLGAAPGPDAALRRLLVDAGIDPSRDGVRIGPVPGMDAPDASFGVLAAEALEAGHLDGFWANALGSETAVRRGVGQILADVRCGDGPPAARHYTFSALVTTEALITRDPEQVAAAVRAIVRVQRALQGEPHQAAQVGSRRFPPEAAAMITTVVEQDLPFYDPVIAESAVAALNRFALGLGLLTDPVPYEQVVATRFRPLWHGRP